MDKKYCICSIPSHPPFLPIHPLPFGDQMPQFSRNSRISHRGFAVDLSSRLITEAWPWVGSEDVGEGPRGVDSKDGGGRLMLDLVVARAWDRAPTVRQVYLPVGLRFMFYSHAVAEPRNMPFYVYYFVEDVSLFYMSRQEMG